MIISGLSEMISLGLVFPFLTILIDPEKIWSNTFSSNLLSLLNFSRNSNLLFYLTISFALASILANGLRIMTLWLNCRISQMIGNDLGYKAYSRTLNQAYSIHKDRNSDFILVTLTNHIRLTIESIEKILTIISAFFILIFLLSTILLINRSLALISIIVLVSSYLYLGSISRKRLLKNGEKFAYFSKKQIKIIQESLGGIRDVILNNKSNYFSSIYKNIDLPLRVINTQNTIISGFPRYTMEAIAMSFIALVSLIMLNNPNNSSTAIPFLGVLALSAQKMLPALQQIFKSWSGLQSNHQSIKELLSLINQKTINIELRDKSKPLNFSKNIKFKEVNFKYSKESNFILKNANFEIKKGEKIGIIGETGSGKTTTVDLIMGLLNPTSGSICIDEKPLDITDKNSIVYSWQKTIAHVPQNIYISDNSFADNIAFGLNKESIDMERVIKSAEQANIRDFIELTPNKYYSLLGERGSKISGGQRQRIGIARALYQERKILILDEATSSLDVKTESSIMEEIENLSLDITIIMISHRLNTLKNCDKIFEIKKGEINPINL